MRDLAHLRSGAKQPWIVSALSLVFVLCVSGLLWLVWSEPDDLPASVPEEQFSAPASSSRSVAAGSAKASSSESSATASQSGAAPVSRPAQHTSVSTTGSGVQKLQNLTINAALTHDENATYYNVYINADGVTLQNKLVTGDLVLSEAVANGAVTLKNVVVKGRILVNGAQTVTLNDVTAVQLIAQRASGTTDYIVRGASTIHQMTAQNQLTIDESGLSSNYAGVKKLATEQGTPMWQQVTLLSGALEQVTTNDATNLLLASGGSVETMIANAPTHIGGSGRVNNLTVCSDEVSYENKPRNITVEGHYSEPSEQNWAIGETEAAANGGSHSGSTSSTLTTPHNLTIAPAVAESSVTLAFDRVSNATSYTVVYSVTNGSDPLNTIDRQLPVDASSCTITHALIGQEGTVVSFKVRAVSSSSRYTASAYSSECKKTVTTLGAPANVQLNLNGNKLALSFTAAANAAACGHEAVLSVDGAVVATLTLAPGVTTGEFTSLTAGKTHTVTVRAVGDGRLALTSATATGTCDVPSLPSASGLAISSMGSELTVTFTGAPGVSDYIVILRYNGSTLSALGNSASGDVYTYRFGRPDAIAAGGEYAASVTPASGLTATETRTVQRRDPPEHLLITSPVLGSVSFSFDEKPGMSYEVVSATQTTTFGTTSLGVTAANLTATGLGTAEGDTFNFSVKTLGDGMLYADSQTASAAEVTVTKLSVPLSPTIGGDQNNLRLEFTTTNSESAHAVAIQTSTDGGAIWSTFSSEELAAGVTQTSVATPAADMQVRFSVTAKAANALQVDSNIVTSSAISVVRLEQATSLDVVDLDSGTKARFQFDAVPKADSYTISYTLSGGGSGSIGVCDYTTAISTPVTLTDGNTVTKFEVTAHATPDATHVYLDSTASHTVP